MLADPDIQLGRCDREQVAAGKVGSQALALLVFLSRSGLKPTVGELRCGNTERTAKGVVTTFPAPNTIYLTAINGVPISGHQGAGTITDITIRTLLTLRHEFAPKRIVSLMKVSGRPQHRRRVRLLRLHRGRAGKARPGEDEQQEPRAKTAHAASASTTVPASRQPDLEHARVAAPDDTAEHAADGETVEEAQRFGNTRQEHRTWRWRVQHKPTAVGLSRSNDPPVDIYSPSTERGARAAVCADTPPPRSHASL